MIKRLSVVVLASVFALGCLTSLSGCGSGDDQSQVKSAPPVQESNPVPGMSEKPKNGKVNGNL